MNDARAIVRDSNDRASVEHATSTLAPTPPDVGRTVRDGRCAVLRRRAGRRRGSRLMYRVTIVTGASRGIGRATAIRLARDFGAVALVART